MAGERLDETRLHALDGTGWMALLEVNPEYADKCPWEKLDSWHWLRLLFVQQIGRASCRERVLW